MQDDMRGNIDSPMMTKSLYLYMKLCDEAASINRHLTLNKKAELREDFQKFSLALIQLYYLVRVKKGFSENLKNKINKWKNAKFNNGNYPVAFYVDSLKLFDDLCEELVTLGILEY